MSGMLQKNEVTPTPLKINKWKKTMEIKQWRLVKQKELLPNGHEHLSHIINKMLLDYYRKITKLNNMVWDYNLKFKIYPGIYIKIVKGISEMYF